MRDRGISITLSLMDREKQSEKSDGAETSSTNFKVTEKVPLASNQSGVCFPKASLANFCRYQQSSMICRFLKS